MENLLEQIVKLQNLEEKEKLELLNVNNKNVELANILENGN